VALAVLLDDIVEEVLVVQEHGDRLKSSDLCDVVHVSFTVFSRLDVRIYLSQLALRFDYFEEP